MASIEDLIDFTQRTLGIDDTVADRYERSLVKEFGAEMIRIPKSDRKWRNAEIMAAYDGKEKTVVKLARQHGISERMVWRIIAED